MNDDTGDPYVAMLQKMLYERAVAAGYAYELLNSLLTGTIKLDKKGKAAIRKAMEQLKAR